MQQNHSLLNIFEKMMIMMSYMKRSNKNEVVEKQRNFYLCEGLSPCAAEMNLLHHLAVTVDSV